MNNKIRVLFKNFFYMIASNLLSLCISILVLLVLPKYLNVEDFSYFQLYILYSSFVGLMHFGVNDGLYLKLGGADYRGLNKSLYFSQFYVFFAFQLALSLVGLGLLLLFNLDENKHFVVEMTVYCSVIVNARYMLLFLLQATYRIKEYSIITVIDRFVFLSLIFTLLVVGESDFHYFILSDLIGKLFTLFLAAYYCKDITLRKVGDLHPVKAIYEIFDNARVGIKLMISNIAGRLIVGNVRLGIEAAWSIVIFGKVSLMLSATGFLMIFINSIGLVLFPFLRNVNENSLDIIYLKIRSGLTFLLLSFLVIYYPVYVVLNYWLPSYQDVLVYLYIIFPIIVFEGKMSLLIDTYLKVLRKESLLLKVNLLVLALSVFVTFFSVFIIKNLELTFFSILLLTSFKLFVFEMHLQKILSLDLRKDMFLDFVFVVLFLLVNKFFLFYQSLLICLLLLLFLFFFKRESFRDLILVFKNKEDKNS